MLLSVAHDIEGIFQHVLPDIGDDQYWQSLVKHCRFLSLMLRPSIAESELQQLQQMLREVHSEVHACWPRLTSLNKFHYILKTVSDAKRKAPPRVSWCMPFEHMHQKIKNGVPITDMKDLCGSIADLASWRLAFKVTCTDHCCLIELLLSHYIAAGV